MNQYKMKPFVGKPIIEVTVPGSKSITNRALLLAALSEGKVLKGVLFSDDSRVFMEALKTLGYEIDVNEKEVQHIRDTARRFLSRRQMYMSEVPERRHVF